MGELSGSAVCRPVRRPFDGVADRARVALRGDLVAVAATAPPVLLGASGTAVDLRVVASFCQYVLAAGAQLIVPDIADRSDLLGHPIHEQLGFVSYAAWPIAGPGGPDLGIVGVFNRTLRDWSSAEVATLETLALECAPALGGSASQ